MLEYNWIDIDVFQEIDVNKIYGSRKCIICQDQKYKIAVTI